MSSIPKIYLDKEYISNDFVTISGDNYHHLKNVLRLKVGEMIIVNNKEKLDHICEISKIDKSIYAKIIKTEESETEYSISIKLFQAFAKGDKMDSIIQKSTELGVTEIYPVLMDRCVSKPDNKSAENKIIRYQKIAEGASSQSGRGIVPVVHKPISYSDALSHISKCDIGFICYEGDDTTPIIDVLNVKSDINSIGFLIGPEGGISDKECMLSVDSGVSLVGLGKRILRTETASSYVLSVISVFFS